MSIAKSLVVALLLSLALAAPAVAVDLAGKTVRAEGISDRRAYNNADKTFTYPLEIYFGTKGNRFVTMGATTGDARVLIEAGKNKGSKRRKDGNFNMIVTIQQSASTVQVKLESRGTTDGYAGEGFTFDIGVSSGSCKVTKFRYSPDPRQGLTRSASKAGACTITNGPPAGLADE